MRGLIALCVGLVMVLGAGAAWAGISEPGTCCSCRCLGEPGRPSSFCINSPLDDSELVLICSGSCEGGMLSCPTPADDDDDELPCDLDSECDGVRRTAFDQKTAPTASPYGIAALLIALGGFGAWRLRKRAAA